MKNTSPEKKLYIAALTWMILGLAGGYFYRTFAQEIHNYYEDTQLAILHTHMLALGMLFMLIALVVERSFHLSKTRWFNLFFWHYNGGLALTVITMLIIGINDVLGTPENHALGMIAGLGHLIITVGLAFFFIALGRTIKK